MSKDMAKLQAQLKAINELAEYDHCFIDEAGVKEFTKPFGFEGSTYEAQDNRDTFKGLSLATGTGTSMRGQDAAETAIEIAKEVFGKSYSTYMQGRGSRLRQACSDVRKHLENKIEVEKTSAAAADLLGI